METEDRRRCCYLGNAENFAKQGIIASIITIRWGALGIHGVIIIRHKTNMPKNVSKNFAKWVSLVVSSAKFLLLCYFLLFVTIIFSVPIEPNQNGKTLCFATKVQDFFGKSVFGHF